LFERFTQPGSPGCALGVFREGALVYGRGYGLANLEYGVPITPSTIFPVASMAKQFTAMAVALLVEAGQLSLDDDIRVHLPAVPDFGDPIAIRHLIHHTSGLRSDPILLILAGWRLEDVITNDDLFCLVTRQQELNFSPGEAYAYCGTGYMLLALIIEQVSKLSLADFCQAHIFGPLGMKNTHFHDNYLHLVPNRAYTYYAQPDGNYRNAVFTSTLVGGTGLFTTVEDLALWEKNFITGRVGGPKVIAQMHQRGVLNDGREIPYAFGLSLNRYRGLLVAEHAGGGVGIRCHMMRFPDQQFSVAVLGNYDQVNAVPLARQVADIHLADQLRETPMATKVPPKAKPDAPSLPDQNLTAFPGRYRSPELDVAWTIRLEDDELAVYRGKQGRSRLVPVDKDVFRDDWMTALLHVPISHRLAFERDSGGAVLCFRISDRGGSVRNLRFVRE
jgi:CubicO group peptidase (beta-lactamase class C family)